MGGRRGRREGRMAWRTRREDGVAGRRLPNGWEVVSRQEATHACCPFVPLSRLFGFQSMAAQALADGPCTCSLCCLHTGSVFKPNTSAYSGRPAQGGPTASQQQVCPGPAPFLMGKHLCVRKPLRKKWGSLNPPRPQTGVYLILIYVTLS